MPSCSHHFCMLRSIVALPHFAYHILLLHPPTLHTLTPVHPAPATLCFQESLELLKGITGYAGVSVHSTKAAYARCLAPPWTSQIYLAVHYGRAYVYQK